MPVVTVAGKKKHLNYPANWSKMSPQLKAAWIRSKKKQKKKA